MLLKKLENYYRNNGILSTDFKCEYFNECRGEMKLTPENAKTAEEVRETFTTAKSALVGECYGDSVPRLLFVSLDPGSAIREGSPANYSSAKSRLPEEVRRINMERAERIKCGGEKSAPRIKGTNNLAYCILRAFNSEIAEDAVIKYYAHINSVKCCMNKKDRKKAAGILFRNCRNYLRGEIELLAPEIVVSHGKDAKKGLDYAFRGENITGKPHGFYICNLREGLSFCWLHTPHPSARMGLFPKHKNGKDGGPGWDGYVKQIKDFINAPK